MPDQKNVPPKQPVERASPKNSFSTAVVGTTAFLVGIFTCFLAVTFFLPASAENWKTFIYGGLGAFVLFAIVLICFWAWAKRKINSNLQKAKKIFDQSIRVHQSDNWSQASEKIQALYPTIAFEVKSLLLKRWYLRVLGAVGIFFAGLFSSTLLYQQNKLIETQNRLIKQQVFLDRRSLGVQQLSQKKATQELNLLLHQVTEYFLLHPDKDTIPPLLVSRIASSSQNFYPYKFPSDPNSEKGSDSLFLSPERGNLFRWLHDGDFANLAEVLTLSDFSFADLRYVEIKQNSPVEKINLEKACLDGAVLSNVNWKHGNLKGLQMRKATLINVSFYFATLDNASFDGSTIAGKIDLDTPQMRDFSMRDIKYGRQADSSPQPELVLNELGVQKGLFDPSLIEHFRLPPHKD